MLNQLYNHIYLSNLFITGGILAVFLLGWSFAGAFLEKRIRLFSGIMAALFVAAILYATLFCRSEPVIGISLEPFSLLRKAADSPEYRRSLIMNIYLFIPLGITLPYIISGSTRKRLLLTAVFGSLLSVVIELIQYLSSLGMAELDDVICNTLGILIGCIAYPLSLLWKNLFSKRSSR